MAEESSGGGPGGLRPRTARTRPLFRRGSSGSQRHSPHPQFRPPPLRLSAGVVRSDPLAQRLVDRRSGQVSTARALLREREIRKQVVLVLEGNGFCTR